MQGNKNEFVIHVKNEHDYRIQTICQYTRKDVTDLLKRVYAEKTGINLPFFHIEANTLKKFCTDEKQAKRGITLMPPSQFRNYDEDLIKGEAHKESVYEKDSQKRIRDDISYLNKNHGAEKDDDDDTNLESTDR
jgi:hypothetical protein